MTFEIRIVYNEKLLQADWMIGALRSRWRYIKKYLAS
jgi:hypothetical protein